MNGVARSDPVFVTARKQLEALARQSPELAAAAAVQQALFPVLWAARAQQPTPTVDVAAAQQALAAGRPILAGQDLDFDPIAAGQCFRHLASAAETALRPGAKRGSHFDGRRRAVSAIHRQAKRGRLDLSAVWQALATGNAATLEVLASGAGLEAQWLRLFGENSLKPAFRAFQAEISQIVDLAGWRRGLCPICGSPPTLAEVQGKEGARRLRCGLCAAGWPYPRVRCAFCANTDPLTLGTLSLEGEAEKYRVQTCGVCHGYLKVVVTFDPIPEDLLAIEDLMTLHLDLIAAERGYSRDKVAA
jgi:FdhE protein